MQSHCRNVIQEKPPGTIKRLDKDNILQISSLVADSLILISYQYSISFDRHAAIRFPYKIHILTNAGSETKELKGLKIREAIVNSYSVAKLHRTRSRKLTRVRGKFEIARNPREEVYIKYSERFL